MLSYLSKVRLIQESRYKKVKMEALLLQPIPFFSGTDDLIVEVEVNVNQDDSIFPIVEINKEIDLKRVLKNGISNKELAVILSPLYH